LQKGWPWLTRRFFSSLQRVGENFVNNARSVNSYLDQTGNLRSSIGYGIVKNGQVVTKNFERKNKAIKKAVQEGGDGVDVGLRFLLQMALDHPRGYVLICVAGMKYAAAVEANGYDVITNSSSLATDELKESLAKLITKNFLQNT